jgi:CHAD domain-containing protein
VELSGATPLWRIARTLLGARVDDFFLCWDRAVHTFGVDDIHDLRVSSRRLREGLLLFAPVYHPHAIRRAGKLVKQVTRSLGALRNVDEALLFFTGLNEEIGASCHGCLAGLLEGFRRDRVRILYRLKRTLAGMDRVTLRRELDGTTGSPALFTPTTSLVDPFLPLHRFARQSMEQPVAAVLTLAVDAVRPEEVEIRHRLRIAVKHLRYRIEILSFLFRADYDDIHAALKGYQDQLGTLHDLDVFAGIIPEGLVSAGDRKTVDEAIAAHRAAAFDGFLTMMQTSPLHAIGERIRSAL